MKPFKLCFSVVLCYFITYLAVGSFLKREMWKRNFRTVFKICFLDENVFKFCFFKGLLNTWTHREAWFTVWHWVIFLKSVFPCGFGCALATYFLQQCWHFFPQNVKFDIFQKQNSKKGIFLFHLDAFSPTLCLSCADIQTWYKHRFLYSIFTCVLGL